MQDRIISKLSSASRKDLPLTHFAVYKYSWPLLNLVSEYIDRMESFHIIVFIDDLLEYIGNDTGYSF